MTKVFFIFLFFFSGQMFPQKDNNNKTILTKTNWFTTYAFLFCKGDLLLQEDSSSVNQLRVLFTNSGQVIVRNESNKIIKKYKLNNNCIELNLSGDGPHGVIMYCYLKMIPLDKSIKLVGIDKKEFINSKKK